ncbi:MAG: hypothetical protein JWQ81_8488 [Amycolatopsis sp.]|uniref:hypothetical protein n=1 Tax=Amycolatopsis sp. TaxID=37632 RepID=UPI00260852D1|nr:hypothetical protein [Amycolatopsis sp.]MCU1687749.1 hypothetical protein [Amycolatopsis sp.]
MVEISDELGPDKIQSLIFMVAWITKHLLDLTGGYRYLEEVIATVEPSARALDAMITAELLAFALAVLSLGHHEPARTCLGALLSVTTLGEVLKVLVAPLSVRLV